MRVIGNCNAAPFARWNILGNHPACGTVDELDAILGNVGAILDHRDLGSRALSVAMQERGKNCDIQTLQPSG